MTWMIPAVTATFLATMVLAFVYYYLYTEYKETFMRMWMWSWLIYSVRFMFMLAYINWSKYDFLLILSEVFCIVSGLLLIWGTYVFASKRPPKGWLFLGVVSIIWVSISPFFQSSFLIFTFIPYLFLGAVYIWTGITFLQDREYQSLGRNITGVSFIVWGIHKADYPFLRPVEWFAPWGYMIGATLTLVVAVGMLVVYFQKMGIDLKNSENKYRTLVESANSIILKIDLNGIITYINEYGQNLFGYTESELLGKNVVGTIVPKIDSQGNNLETMVKDSITDNKSYETNENENTCKDGSRLWIIWSNQTIYDNKGKKEGVLCVGKDITERKKMELKLKQSEEFLSNTQKIAGVGSWHLDIVNDVLSWSDECYRIFGYEPGEVEANYETFLKSVHPDDRDYVNQAYTAAVNERKPYEILHRVLTKDGTLRYVKEISEEIRDKNGQAIESLGMTIDITDIKKTELQLVENERLLRSIADNYPNSYMSIIDKDLTVGFTSGQEFKKQKIDPSEFIGLTLDQVFGEKANTVKAHYLKTFDGEEQVFEIEIDNQHQLYRTVPLISDKGDVTKILSVVENITDKKEHERILQEMKLKIGSQELYSVLVEMAADGFWLLDKNFITVYVNPAIEKMLGYDSKEMIGKSWYDFGDPEWVARAKELERRRESGVKEAHQFLFIHKNGNKVLTRIATTPLSNKDGSFNGALGILSDITKQAEAEEALKVRDFVKVLSDSAGLGINLLNPDYTIDWCNNLYSKWFGEIDQIKGRNCFEIFMSRNTMCEECPSKISFDKGEVVNTERFGVKTSEGNNRILSVTTSPIRDDSGSISQVVVITQDITNQKEAEKLKLEALEQENFATIGRVTGKMAHDFNNVLGIIMGTSQLLLSEDLPAGIISEIDIIKDCALKGRELTRNLLFFAKDQETKLSQIDLNERIESVLRSLKTELKSIKVNISYGLDMDSILADVGLLENAIINLILNSIHAVSKSDNPQLNIKTYIEERSVCIEIEDNGCGIPDEWKDKIYDPSVTLKGSADRIGLYQKDIKGSGYGLANVKRCVDKHGGEITFNSELGKGTKFKLSLPIIKGEITEKEEEQICKSNISGKRILIVEDEPQYGRILFSLLEKFNHNITLATDGKMALNAINNNLYDAISLDYILPDMSGMDVYKKIRETNKEIPVIFVSGNFEFMQSMIDLKKEDPNVGHLAKPFDNVEYVNKINEWLEPRQ